MLALLLALSPGAVAFQTPAPTAQPPVQHPAPEVGHLPAETGQPAVAQSDRSTSEGNTTSVMTLGGDPDRTAFVKLSLSLGNALATDYEDFETQLSVNSLDQQLRNADSVEDRQQVLNRYRFRIENRIISLQAEERKAMAAFSNGTISEREYLRQLGHIDAQAAEIRDALDVIQSRSENVPRFTLESEVSALEGQLVTLEGPVRERISRATRGEAVPVRVFVSTTRSGIVLSSIIGSDYVREVVRLDRRNPGQSTRLSNIEAQRVVLDRYPWAPNHTDSGGIITSGFASTNVYYVSVSHQHGDLVTYVDGGTEQIFREIQHKRLVGENSLPPGPGVNGSSENLTLVVNRTYAGGPLRVQLINATGEPLQGEITVDGEPAGRTSVNGVLWTLGPTESFSVSATYDGRTVNLTTTPVDANTPENATVTPVNGTTQPD